MAQLYKMTLYVCDLEENLSLDEIKCLVSERALDGISVSSICRFADEQIGEQVEWDDDIDLNKCNCPTSTWDKYFKPPIQPQTKADRIRAMSDEELAASHLIIPCFYDDDGYGECKFGWHERKQTCEECKLEWLKQPAED